MRWKIERDIRGRPGQRSNIWGLHKEATNEFRVVRNRK